MKGTRIKNQRRRRYDENVHDDRERASIHGQNIVPQQAAQEGKQAKE